MSIRTALPGTSPDAVPPVDDPEPDTDRGLHDGVDVSVIAFAAVLTTLVVVGRLTGDPVTWSEASGVVSNALTAAAIAGGVGWLFGHVGDP